MRSRLFPVIVTAASTSLVTLFAVSCFLKKTPLFLTAASERPPMNYASYTSGNLVASPANFENAAEGSINAVVHINTSTEGRIITQNSIGDVWGQLFGQRQYYLPPQTGSGSGVIISPDGYIVTNNHVIANASNVQVTFNNRHTSKAKVVGTDPSTDIAVLKVEDGNSLPYMEFGNSDDVKLGQWVLAVGYPLNLDATVTAGIVSAKGRSLGLNHTQPSKAIESFIQTDAAVNPGNSGGALINTSGQLVGINSAIASPTGSYAGYSYAIPANIVRKAVNDLIKYGSVQRAYLGLTPLDFKSVTPDQVVACGADKYDGVYIVNVAPGGGAEKAGIKQGDFLQEINGTPVRSSADVLGQIARFQPGDHISVQYTRGGKQYNTTVQLTNYEGATALLKNNAGGKLLGATFRPASNGLQIIDVGKGPLEKANVTKGFVITGIDDIVIRSTDDLEKAITNKQNMQVSGYYPGRQGMYYFSISNADLYAAGEL